jgi:DNA repair protein RecO (recombination protein O)
MRERVYRIEAVVLRRSSYGEADRLLTLYTPLGKRRVVAKGARKTTSRLAGHIELFTYAQLLLATGKNLDIVTQSAVLEDFVLLRGELSRISSAYYVAELLDRLTEEGDENQAAFALLVGCLRALDTSGRIDLVLRWFELHLLEALGYRPQLTDCVHCHATLTEAADRYSTQSGGVLCPNCAATDRSALAMSLAAFKLLRYLQSQSVDAIEQMNISMALRQEVERLLRATVRHILERDLKSVVFLDEVRQS